MTEENVETAPPVADAQPGPAEGSAQAPQTNPNDFEAKLRSDPDFAVQFAKEQQSAASKARDRLSKMDPVQKAAEILGNGNLEAGTQAILNDLVLVQALRKNADGKQILDRLVAGQPLREEPPANPYDPGSYESGTESEQLTKLREEFRVLQGKQAQIETSTSFQHALGAIREFQKTDIGESLEPAQWQAILTDLEGQMRSYAQTPDGRQFMSNLDADTVETIALKTIRRKGWIFDLGPQRSSKQTAQLRERETDGPSRTQTSGAVPAATRGQRPEEVALAAIQRFRRENGLPPQ